MENVMHNIYKSGWFFGLKVALMLLSFYFIFFHISQDEVMHFVKLLKKDFLENRISRNYLFAVSGLMLLNWFIESLKWKYLTSVFYVQSVLIAGRAVLSGLAVSIFTPNRSGDFVGRIMHLPPKMRMEGVVFSVIGSVAQLLITVSAGAIALLLLFNNFFIVSEIYIIVGAAMVLMIMAFLHYSFFYMRKYWRKLSQINALRKYSAIISDTSKLSPSFLFKIYGLSLLRYAVFSFQFCLLIKAFQIDIPFSISICLVMISFLFITAIPSFAISEIGIRGSICIFFFSKFTHEETGVLIASTALWLINIATPAFIGAFGMLYFKKIK